MNEFETRLLERVTKIEDHLSFLTRYLMDINLVFTTIAAQYLELEDETVHPLIRELRKQVLDVYLAKEGE
jgi:hypothetical protein